ncbi:MAG: flagellar hook-associated protein FlgK [Acidaminococcales bacterium]|jgi:flagellar hook-associated protein 1 FlgK|nr:flagellar hook-associated protein FlgK [Acidaminococcales bacterium]
MLSAFLGLNTSKLGLMSHQSALYTTGHNIANADTVGYSRQMVTKATMPSVDVNGALGSYWVGTGVDIQSVNRARDFLVDRQFWKQTATNAYFSNLNYVQSKMETIFTEPSDTNFQAGLDKFWTSVQNVAANPGDMGTRTTMLQSAVDLVDKIQTAAKQLGDQVVEINDNIRKSVDRINQINVEILSLNKQIALSEVNGAKANDLRDKRDLLVDELSQYARVNVTEDKRGNYTVVLDGQVVADAMSATKLEVYENKNTEIYRHYGYQTLNVRVVTIPPVPLKFTDGSVAGLLEARDSDRQGVLSKLNMLDGISKALLCDFNQIHKEGLGLDNSTGLNFFGEQDWVDPLTGTRSALQYAAIGSTLSVDPATGLSIAPGTNPITGLPISSDAGFDPAASGANNTERNWIRHLKVNDIFFDPTSGLEKIAAKTLAGNLEVTLSTSNRVSTIAPTVPGTVPPPAKAIFVGESQIVFKGPAEQRIQIRVNSVNADGFIDNADYTMDAGATWLAADCTSDTGRSVLKLQGIAPFEYNIQVAVDPRTDENTLAAGDTYDLVLYPSTGGAAQLVNTAYTRFESRNQYTFTIADAAVDPTGRVTAIKLSLDGKNEYATYTVGPIQPAADGKGNVFTISGVLPDGNAFTFELEIKDDIGNVGNADIAKADKYVFKMPPSEAASDNAVRLSQFLKYGADDAAVTVHSMYMGDATYKPALSARSIDEEYNDGLGALGVQTQTSYSMWMNQTTLVEQITTVRANYKDVSLDEEMTNMIMFQKGYNSNARMLTAMDEMLDRLINGTGRVGL